jgi:hypothetical protein
MKEDTRNVRREMGRKKDRKKGLQGQKKNK